MSCRIYHLFIVASNPRYLYCSAPLLHPHPSLEDFKMSFLSLRNFGKLMSAQEVKSIITLKGSSKIVTDFLECAVNKYAPALFYSPQHSLFARYLPTGGV